MAASVARNVSDEAPRSGHPLKLMSEVERRDMAETYIIEYWRECISEALEHAGVSATLDKIKLVAGDVEIAHQCYGQAFPVPENHLIHEVSNLKRKLEVESQLSFCRRCQGSGRITEHFGSWTSNEECPKCFGAGKVKS